MTIQKKKEDTTLEISLEGRLDTVTAPALEAELRESAEGITELKIDLEKLEYISSAGLRVLLAAQKLMSRRGTMTVSHVNETVGEIFDITGFTDILHII